ncbi:MAG: DNA-binding protein WhiA [Candidatus Geothermincolia bacterium]
MSFTVDCKNELARITPRRKCCRIAELSALLRLEGRLHLEGREKLSIHAESENAAVARKIFTLAKELFGASLTLEVEKVPRPRKHKGYYLYLSEEGGAVQVLNELGILDHHMRFTYKVPKRLVKTDCCAAAYLRGAFLGGGFVADPARDRHLEITVTATELAQDLAALAARFDIPAQVTERKRMQVFYLKSTSAITSLLAVMGAYHAVMAMENKTIVKELRNKVNRVVNCDTANLNKTVSAASRQVETIKKLDEAGELDRLPRALKDVARARLDNPDLTVTELGALMEPPLSKSATYHRLRRLMGEDAC